MEGRRISFCLTCGQLIEWGITLEGERIALDKLRGVYRLVDQVDENGIRRVEPTEVLVPHDCPASNGQASQ